MRLIRGLRNLQPEDRGCVATIGTFDGVHQGHRAVFNRLLAKGRLLGLPATVITFEPQPLEFLTPELAPPRLTRLREKLTAIAAEGIARVMLLRFGPGLANMRAVDFIERLLVDGLGVRYLLVGDDFRFGHNREGDYELLCRVGAALGPPEATSPESTSAGATPIAGTRRGFTVENLHTIRHGETRISSTRVREALARGDLDQARLLLGRPYSICGRVAHGDKLGRTIGFPTANLPLRRRRCPLSGVYAVLVHDVAPTPLPGVANIGRRPTIDGTDERLEVHLFDCEQDLYGRHLRVEFCLRLRGEQRFDSFAALREQIARDAAAARQFFAR